MECLSWLEQVCCLESSPRADLQSPMRMPQGLGGTVAACRLMAVWLDRATDHPLAGEHDALEAAGWRVHAWQASGGYGNRSKRGKQNARRERLWFSPHCVFGRGLFDADAA